MEEIYIVDEPAFPTEIKPNAYSGMTLRDYFAAQALPAVFENASNISTTDSEVILGIPKGTYNYKKHFPHLVAREAYRMADAMLAERTRKP